ncbi:hypothetical protein Rsub_04331 [Raphidocelis subcapitata]|uniref:Uncharacterized protein n=1 Tax=Raphidocelis subcapitata TaxID=307507 RepID=A0A2V0NVE2_9CHLO|nr:hypothetical protein Rsub_04331 [Raphidocelis subcapitata]|eukprot:GBF91591.1 hypothetical protein Rsub_04331 [Raphidocelis subcapitata]
MTGPPAPGSAAAARVTAISGGAAGGEGSSPSSASTSPAALSAAPRSLGAKRAAARGGAAAAPRRGGPEAPEGAGSSPDDLALAGRDQAAAGPDAAGSPCGLARAESATAPLACGPDGGAAAWAAPPPLRLPPCSPAGRGASNPAAGAFGGNNVDEPSTPQEADRLAAQQEGSFDDGASSLGDDAGNKGSRMPTPEADPCLSSLQRPGSSSSAATTEAQLPPGAAALSPLGAAGLSLAQQVALLQQQTLLAFAALPGAAAPAAAAAPQRGGGARSGGQRSSGSSSQLFRCANPVGSGVVGTFFPVERPRPPPAGDQVNFAQRIMEICFAGATQWPMNLELQFVVDGAARGAAVEVTVGRSICKSQVSGSRQVIYYVRNPALLRLARSFDARTVGYRLAGPTTLEWHLSTAPTPPAPAPASKPATARRKAAAATAAAPKAQRGGEELWARANGGGGAGGEQHPLAPELIGQLAQLLGSGASPAELAAAMAAAAPGGPHRSKRRKQEHPSRAPFYGYPPGTAGVFHMLPSLLSAGGEDGGSAALRRKRSLGSV